MSALNCKNIIQKPRAHPAIFIITVISALVLLYPFIVPIILAIITAYVLRPIVKRLETHTRSYHLALGLIVMAIAIPLVLGIVFISSNSSFLFKDITDMGNILKTAISAASDAITASGFGAYAGYILSTKNIMAEITSFAISIASDILKNTPLYFIDFIIYAYASYHFMIDGQKITKFIKQYSDTLSSEDAHFLSSILQGLKRSFDVLFLSYITMSVIITVTSFIAYSIFSVPHAFILALITGVFGFLPIFAAWMVYVPIAAYMYYLGNTLAAIGVLIFGISVLNIVMPVIIQPYLGSKKSGVSALTILLGFFSGPVIFGVKGLLLGPILFVMIETIIVEYMRYRIENAKTCPKAAAQMSK